MNLSELIRQLQTFESEYGHRPVRFHSDLLGCLIEPHYVYVMYPPPWVGGSNSIVLDDKYEQWADWFVPFKDSLTDEVVEEYGSFLEMRALAEFLSKKGYRHIKVEECNLSEQQQYHLTATLEGQ